MRISHVEVPKQLSFCLRFFLEYASQKAGFWDGMGLFQVWTHERTSKDGASIEFNVHANYPLFKIMDADTVKDFRRQTNDPYRQNLLRKWNSVCYSVDFGKVNQTCQMSWNGQVVEEKVSTGLEWGWNYGMGKLGVNFTLGKYWNGPYFIGKFVEFNAWDRILTEEEHLQYSICENYFAAKGNLMSQEDRWENNNKFIVDYEVDWDEIQCSKNKNAQRCIEAQAYRKD